MVDTKFNYGIKRLESKTARNAIIQKLSHDFNLTPIIAEAYYQKVAGYFNEHANVSLSSGEVAYEAVAADEPAGKHIRLTRKVTVRLKLLDFNADFESLANYGLAGLRQHPHYELIYSFTWQVYGIDLTLWKYLINMTDVLQMLILQKIRKCFE